MRTLRLLLVSVRTRGFRGAYNPTPKVSEGFAELRSTRRAAPLPG